MKADIYEYEFSFTQQQVTAFAELTGDNNPVHLNAEYAAWTPFKKPVAHGMLTAGVISKVLGTIFPGEGTIYLGQQLDFLRPVYPGDPCKVMVSVESVNEARHTAILSTIVINTATGKKLVSGKATVMHKEKF